VTVHRWTPSGRSFALFRQRLTDALACLLVLLVFIAPNEISRLTPVAFVSVPVEGLLGVALLLILPAWARRVMAMLLGVALGLLAVLKMVDMGFFEALGRPFDPVLDWVLLGDGAGFLTSAFGRTGAIGAVVAAVVLVASVLILVTGSVLRLTRIVIRHDSVATQAVAMLAVLWITCALTGAQLAPGIPIAGRGATTLIYDRAQQVHADLHDQQAFAAAAGVDPFRATPGTEMLSGLRGKNVVLAFVESYGRVAVEDPELSPQVDAVLESGDRRLRAAGFKSKSAFLTSPTAGGGSWLAHSTLLSGLWIDNQQRDRTLVASDRLTLTGAFRRAGWRTVGVMPGNTSPWPEGAFFGYDRVYDSQHLGYRGPNFSWATMPDQYTLTAFQRLQQAIPRGVPVMAEIPLVSSHAPWSPIPRLIDWRAVGDGSVFNSMAAKGYPPEAILTRDPTRVRTDYRLSIEYSLNSLISYVETYGDDKLVLVFLGDHQPAPVVTGAGASRDVPVTIVARDPSVLDRISGWGWQDGLKPGPQAPVWRMDAFRNRFLTAFGPQGPPPARRR
jgi:hypothetical protein